jgi:CBS domain containing-hemolysin-like protein
MEIALALGLAAVGIFLSAFFNGTETGFYRAARVRLVLDALGGDRVARGLVWLTNHPLLLVATVMVGNNLGDYVTAMAVVMGTRSVVETPGGAEGVITGSEYAVELIAPLALAPLLFVYGQLLPKHLFLQAPNRLLRQAGPLLLVSVVLLFPVSALLWLLNNLLARVVGESPEQIRLTLTRRELRRVLEEGHEAGILHAAQRALARGIFAVAQQPVARFVTSLSQWPRARPDLGKEELLQLARQHRISVIPVESSGSSEELAGYYRVIDLSLTESESPGPPRRFLEIAQDTPHVAALMRMQSAQEELARVVNPGGETVGIVTADRLREPLFRGGK